MSFSVKMALFKDPKTTKVEIIAATDAITAMQHAERNNPSWISVSAEKAA